MGANLIQTPIVGKVDRDSILEMGTRISKKYCGYLGRQGTWRPLEASEVMFAAKNGNTYLIPALGRLRQEDIFSTKLA